MFNRNKPTPRIEILRGVILFENPKLAELCAMHRAGQQRAPQTLTPKSRMDVKLINPIVMRGDKACDLPIALCHLNAQNWQNPFREKRDIFRVRMQVRQPRHRRLARCQIKFGQRYNIMILGRPKLRVRESHRGAA